MRWFIAFLAGASVGFVLGCLVDNEPAQEKQGYYYPPSKEWRPTDTELDRELGRFFAPGNGGAER